MKQSALQTILKNLDDERSKRVVFVSHCLLNENTRYLGGAWRPGCVDELVDRFQQEGVGIYQMKCPEQRVWGSVLKRYILHGYGSKGTLLYRIRQLYIPLFIWYTKFIYSKIAKKVVRDIEDYVRSGFEVVGIVGVDGSPSCAVNKTLNTWSSVEALASLPIKSLERQTMNDKVIADCLTEGKGFFMKALWRQLRRRSLDIKFYRHDLLAEMRGEPIQLLPSD